MATVLIVGKPNVGKSTLFNRLIRKRKAIVEDDPGVTRDSIQDRVEWRGKFFTLVDTCGIFENPEGIVEKKMKEMTLDMLKEGDLLLFVVDGREGLTSEDHHLADFVRKSGADVILVANKVEDKKKYENEVKPELYSLGFGEPIPVSSEHSLNIDTLLEKIVEKLESKGLELKEEKREEAIKVAIIGKPNVGKSSLFNAILGMERTLVTPLPGTTRDAVDEEVEVDGKRYIFIDTAGMRRRSRIEPKTLERYGTYRTVEAIERADVVVLVLDAMEGISRQDQRLAGLVERRGKAIVTVFNKWDLVEHRERRKEEYLQLFKEKLYFVDFSPLVFVSATTKVPTSSLNAALEKLFLISPPPSKGGRKVRIYFGLQVDVKPPVFLFFTNRPDDIPKSYQNSIKRAIRTYVHPFTGSPIFLKFKKSR
ncbi:MAG: ribosome biogenesis GTPase Der [Thermotoga sp. 4484_232]|nr:MAG: ribosome biogenesis GTPase Der [Thermotoga sp. 4484_232]